MKKTILGVSILIILVGIMISNVVSDRQADSEIIETESGGMITSGNAAGIDPGSMAPDFQLETLDGEVVQLSDYQGKKVMLNFWASWCPPCKEEMPEMQDFHEDYGDEIVILAVNNSEDDPTVQSFLEEHEYTFTSPLDRDGAIGDEYSVLSLPTTYFINTDGIVQEPRHMGPMTYGDMVEMKDILE